MSTAHTVSPEDAESTVSREDAESTVYPEDAESKRGEGSVVSAEVSQFTVFG